MNFNPALIIEGLAALAIMYGTGHLVAIFHLFSMDRKLTPSEFKQRKRCAMFLTFATLSILYVGYKFSTLNNADQFLAEAPLIGMMGFIGIGCSKFASDCWRKVAELTPEKPVPLNRAKAPSTKKPTGQSQKLAGAPKDKKAETAQIIDITPEDESTAKKAG